MKTVALKNPTAAMSPKQGYFLCKLVAPDCRHKPAVDAMIASGITMQQAYDGIEFAKAKKQLPALRARIEELASAAGVEINPNWRENKTVAAKAAPTIPQELLERVAELTAQNGELREVTAGGAGESVPGMTWVKGHYRKSK